MSDQDLMKLYSGQILALAAAIPHQGRLAAPQASITRRSPLCGSTVTVDVVAQDGRVAEFAQDVRACALGQASAAILGQVAHGRSLAELREARRALHAMLTADAAAPDSPFDGFAVLAVARDYRNRHASILLALDALIEAMAKTESEQV